ncbi:MAG: apolipoprotein N-acyltransferase [Sandaracinus sp.]
MAKSGKRSGKGRAEAKAPKTEASETETAETGEASTTATKSTASPPLLPLAIRLRAHAILLVSSVLMFLGFAGFGVWWMGFFALVPALFVVDPREDRGGFDRPGGRTFFFRAWMFGTVAYAGGFYWIAYTLSEFSGFPIAIASLFATIFWAWQGLQFVAMLWIFRRARMNGWAASLAVPAAYVATEAVFPMLFEHYYGNGLYRMPILTQIADLAGPETCTGLVFLVNGAIYDLVFARGRGQPMPRLGPAIALGAVIFSFAYGGYRLAQVDAFDASAERLHVALIQPNLGLFDRWEDPRVGDRSRQMTVALEQEDPAIQLFVWPESAVTYWLDDVHSVHRTVLRDVHTPVIFGGIRHAELGDRIVDRNTAFLADAQGRFIGTYDKTYLLAFGEYLPFGEAFPMLYEVSPMSGRFSPGASVDPLELPLPGRDEDDPIRMSALICYEDIVSRFVRHAVEEAQPDFLVNVTVDTWFGDTQEPWVHLTLATFRAIEHRRWLVRSTNSGVSAFIDPAGRVVAHTGTFEQASLVDDVRLGSMGTTLYELLGPWLGWISLFLAAFCAARPAPARWMLQGKKS